MPDNAAFRLSVVVPVYNEAETVELCLRRVADAGVATEIIVIDDGSTDGTADVLEGLAREGLVDRLIRHPENRGKGAAVRAGIDAAGGDAVVVQDADLEYDPRDLPRLIAPIRSGLADAVLGSRFLGGPHRVLYFWHSVGNGLLTMVSNMFTNLNLTDMETGYKMIRTDVARRLNLTADRFGIEPELVARLAQARARVYEVPISYHGRTYAEGKKIDWKDGVAALWHILRFNAFRSRTPHGPSRPQAADSGTHG